MKFTKMHGCGNDYIYIDGSAEHIAPEKKPGLVRFMSDRHFGIGGDGVIFINPAPEGFEDADFEMEMYNADGSRSEMCGNGIRCVGAYVFEKGLTSKKELTIVSAGSRKYLTLQVDDSGRVSSVTVDMGSPIIVPADIPIDPAHAVQQDPSQPPAVMIDACGRTWKALCVSVGNPHAVVILDDDTDLASFDLAGTGPQFESHPYFPNRINTEFVHVDSRSEVHMRVWERGTGETLACGTGCTAITAVCALTGITEDEITLHVLGGEIICRYDRASGHIFMTGEAVTIFEGDIAV